VRRAVIFMFAHNIHPSDHGSISVGLERRQFCGESFR
jgi:hypothetical protein